MTCDGQKKIIVEDSDGSFFGEPGTAISESEWQWEDNPSYGLGDYRIPVTMLTEPDGDRIPTDGANGICPNKGIIRDDSCTYLNGQNAHFCPSTTGLHYELVIVESMDADTLTRRLSPIGGYLTLRPLKGPDSF